MTPYTYKPGARSGFSDFKRIPGSEDWFELYEIADDLFIFYEPRHYEEPIVYLIVGKDKAILIDTGCGIGNIRKAVEELTDKPVMVLNTHTHLDHIGGNNQFDDIAMYDHPVSRYIAENGVSHKIFQEEILADNLIEKPWPKEFDPSSYELSPFKVNRWLRDGDRVALGGLELEVIHTPGEAINHICLLDRPGRRLFCGDILLLGPVWTHLDGGNLEDLLSSYQKLMNYVDEFDYLMPSHNVPKVDKHLLQEALIGTDKVLSGKAGFSEIVDPWNRRLKQYSFDRFQILTK